MTTFISRHKRLLIVTFLTLIFVIPLLMSWLAYSRGMFLSKHTVNHGTLLNPPIQISFLNLTCENGAGVSKKQLQGKWWLLYVTANESEQLSLRNLYYMAQIRQATGKDRKRIARAIVTVRSFSPTYNNWLHENYPGTDHFVFPQEKLALTKRSLYLVDPLGNIMMQYAPDAAPKGILKDLERVLKVSQVG